MSPIPIPFPSNNLRSTISTLHLRSIISNCFSTTTTTTRRIKPVKKVGVSDDELKQQWLNSLNSPTPILLKQKQTLNHDNNNNCENVSNTYNDDYDDDLPWVIGIDPDVSGALAVLKTFPHSSAQVFLFTYTNL